VILKELQGNWDKLGKVDPLWAIASDPAKRGNKWDRDEFFATGKAEVDGVLAYLAAQGVTLNPGQALDFGCGVGRVTQALCTDFDQVYGVDIAPSMLELAASYNRYGDRCHYVLNDVDDLRRFADGSMDFVYSVIVLQHIRPAHSRKYIREFLRVLAPGGVTLFQVPSHLRETPADHAPPQSYASGVWPLLRRWAGQLVHGRTPPAPPVIEMHAVCRHEVEQLVEAGGGRLIDVQQLPYAGPEWVSYRYLVHRS
jgi:SAM-dependent methyltransferase